MSNCKSNRMECLHNCEDIDIWNIAKAPQRIIAQIPAKTIRFFGLILFTILLENIKNIISAITDTLSITPESHLADMFILSKYNAL